MRSMFMVHTLAHSHTKWHSVATPFCHDSRLFDKNACRRWCFRIHSCVKQVHIDATSPAHIWTPSNNRIFGWHEPSRRRIEACVHARSHFPSQMMKIFTLSSAASLSLALGRRICIEIAGQLNSRVVIIRRESENVAQYEITRCNCRARERCTDDSWSIELKCAVAHNGRSFCCHFFHRLSNLFATL